MAESNYLFDDLFKRICSKVKLYDKEVNTYPHGILGSITSANTTCTFGRDTENKSCAIEELENINRILRDIEYRLNMLEQRIK